MTVQALTEILEKSATSLFANQPTIFDFTSETNQTEWNLAHHLANEIHKFFPTLDCDLDLIKPNLGRRRPDIVFHARGSHDHNLLVIEVKRDGGTVELAEDLRKIEAYWFSDLLRYQFGAVVDLRSNKTYEILVKQRELSRG